MGSRLSRRRKAFPDAFQHDSMLTARNCGGPVVNIDGQIIGINIARAGRVANYSLPVSTIDPIVAELKTGDLAPEIVNKEAIKKVDLELEENALKLVNLPNRVTEMDREIEIDEVRLDELDQIMNALKERRKNEAEQLARKRNNRNGLKDDLKHAEQTRDRLEDNRKLLSTGRR